VLRFPDFDQPFMLHVDGASTMGIGVCLMQKDDAGREYAVGYGSRSLTKCEKAYGPTELEVLALVWGIRRFRPYLEGQRFFAITDHSAIVWLMKARDTPNPRLLRWMALLQGLDMELCYKKGALHVVPDALSRAPVGSSEAAAVFVVASVSVQYPVMTVEEHTVTDLDRLLAMGRPGHIVAACQEIAEHLDPGSLKTAQETDHLCLKIRAAALSDAGTRDSALAVHGLTADRFTESSGLLMFKYRRSARAGRDSGPQTRTALRIVVPDTQRFAILRLCHDIPVSGHLGKHRTLARVQERFWWPGMTKDVKQYVLACAACAGHKGTPKHMSPLEGQLADRPMSLVGVDTFGPLPLTKRRNRYVVAMQDLFTRWIVLVPLPEVNSATVAHALHRHLIAEHGMPRQILSDNGPPYGATLLTELLSRLGIERRFAPEYHPEANGVVERLMDTIRPMIAQFTSEAQNDWDLQIPSLSLAYNTSVHQTTRFTPFFLVHGREAFLPLHLWDRDSGMSEMESLEGFAKRIGVELSNAFAIVNSSSSKTDALDRANKKRGCLRFEQGDKVWLNVRTRYEPRRSKKFKATWVGPYVIIEKVGKNTFVLESVSSGQVLDQVVAADRLKRFYLREGPVLDPRGSVVATAEDSLRKEPGDVEGGSQSSDCGDED